MTIYKSNTNNAAKLQLQSARALKSKSIDEEQGGKKNKMKDHTADSTLPNNIVVHPDTENTDTFFDKLLNCWGANLSCSDYIQSEMSRSQARQDEDQEMKKLKKEKEAAIARKKKMLAAVEAAQADKAAAAEKAKRVRDLAQQAADARMKQQEDAREAAEARQLQAEIEADAAKEASDMKTKMVAEARRQMKKAMLAMKLAKKEAKKAKKMAKKEAKQAKRAEKEARVIAKKTNAARQKYDKAEAAAAKKMAREEKKKAAATRRLLKQMEEEESRIRDKEENIHELRQRLNAFAANGRQSTISYDSETVCTEDECSTIIPPSSDEMSNEDFVDVLSDMIEEASILLGK